MCDGGRRINEEVGLCFKPIMHEVGERIRTRIDQVKKMREEGMFILSGIQIKPMVHFQNKHITLKRYRFKQIHRKKNQLQDMIQRWRNIREPVKITLKPHHPKRIKQECRSDTQNNRIVDTYREVEAAL